MTPIEWHQELFDLCAYLGMDCLSTPFDETAVDFLEKHGCGAYKVASFEITDLPLIRYIARTGKPMLMSTGMATMEEITIAVNTAKSAGCIDLTLLKCTSAYPSSHKDANLETMIDMAMRYACPVGISDHSKGITVPVAAAMMGAECIEKHLKLNEEHGPDSQFSLNPAEFGEMVQQVRAARQAVGKVQYGPGASEMDSLLFRRGLYVTQDLIAGDTITIENCRPRRPSMGIQPSFMNAVLGMRIKKDAKAGTPLQWDILISEEANLQ
jgi:sialic acid synthase SpsE